MIRPHIKEAPAGGRPLCVARPVFLGTRLTGRLVGFPAFSLHLAEHCDALPVLGRVDLAAGEAFCENDLAQVPAESSDAAETAWAEVATAAAEAGAPEWEAGAEAGPLATAIGVAVVVCFGLVALIEVVSHCDVPF